MVVTHNACVTFYFRNDMTREEIIKEFDKAGINFDYANHKEDGRTANWIDDNFCTVLDLVEKLVSKNESLHLVSCCEHHDAYVVDQYHRRCRDCGKELCNKDYS